MASGTTMAGADGAAEADADGSVDAAADGAVVGAAVAATEGSVEGAVEAPLDEQALTRKSATPASAPARRWITVMVAAFRNASLVGGPILPVGRWPASLADRRQPTPPDPSALDDARPARRDRWTLVSSAGGPADGQRPRLAEDEAGRGGGATVEPQVGPRIESRVEGGQGLEPGEVDPDAGVRTLGEGEMGACIRPRQVESVRVGDRRPDRGWPRSTTR